MTADVRELLPLYALGILDTAEANVVERAVAADPALAVELASYQEATLALIAPMPAAPDVAARLLASIGGGRFEKFSTRMSSLFDVSVEQARELLGLIERPASWNAELPGITLVHFDGGPACTAADCGFIRLGAGTTFPPHTHLGEEVSVVLTGVIRDASTGRLVGPGDELVQAEGSQHYLIAEGDAECIFAARAMNGITIAGAPARPSRPR